MEIEEARVLVEKYWDCETTFDEEDALYEFFNTHKQEDLPADLQLERPYFADDEWNIDKSEDDFLDDEFKDGIDVFRILLIRILFVPVRAVAYDIIHVSE